MSEARDLWSQCWPTRGAADCSPRWRWPSTAALPANRNKPCRCAGRWRMPNLSRSSSGTLFVTATSQRLMNTDATRADIGLQTGSDPALDAAQGKPRPRQIFARARRDSSVTLTENPAKMASSIAVNPCWRAGYLDKKVGTSSAGVQILATDRLFAAS